jgi:RNA-directed DNA polymerase
VNTDALWPTLEQAEARVLGIQTKLHQWATDSPQRQFSDLFNLVCDPAFLTVAWARVRGNRGARSAGVDGVKPRDILFGTETFLPFLRDDLKTGRFAPLPVRERMIPKAPGKLRHLGIPTARDRCVQASLKLVLEPIFEADFKPCSYGFRPRRRAQDAIEEIFFYTTHYYEWVLEGDIKACFDEISHSALLNRMRRRIGDRRILALVKSSSKPGSSVRTRWKGTRSPAPPKVAS